VEMQTLLAVEDSDWNTADNLAHGEMLYRQ